MKEESNEPKQIPVNPHLQPNELVKPLDLPPDESRVEKHLKKNATRNLLFVLGGIGLLGIFLFFFGIPLLIGLSTLMQQNNHSQTTTPIPEEITVDKPTLSSPFDATNSAKMKLTGRSKADYEIELYRNGRKIADTTVKDNGKFTFANVTLEEGGNILKAKAVYKDKESDYSDSVIITYSNSKPTVEITFPQDGQIFRKDASPIPVKGQTSEGNTVMVNGGRAVVDGNGSFTYSLPLSDGENTIKAEATDEAGNTVNKEIKIKVE